MGCFSYFILLTIHLFIFNAGPMLIAVFITEMVILHKYVYLLLLLLTELLLIQELCWDYASFLTDYFSHKTNRGNLTFQLRNVSVRTITKDIIHTITTT